jgi:hypothetical protein
MPKLFDFQVYLRWAVFTMALLGTTSLYAGDPRASASVEFVYHFQSEDGTNASAVTWIPEAQVYVTCIAGNVEYPLEVFDAQGKTIYSGQAGLDLRGLWYNPATQQLEGNCAGEEGWYSIAVDLQGIPSGDWQLIREGQNQPDFQSVLSYIDSKKKLVTLADGELSFWTRKNGKSKTVKLTDYDSDFVYFDYTTAAYTGDEAYPIALLELNNGRIMYFDLKGKYTGKSTTIEGGIPEIEGFRFAFANGRAFIYDEIDRDWRAYKVF